MITLQKFLYIAIITTLPLQCFGETFKAGDSGRCYVISRIWPNRDSFYYCGNQNKGCAGVADINDSQHWLMHGKSFSRDGTTYWCCNGSQTKNSGKFKIGSSSWVQTRTQTKTLPNGGTCTYTQTKTACDDTWQGTECTTAECPNDGEIFRNGECVKPCDAPSVFAAPDSNKCITCEENTWRGIGVDGNYNPTCISCNPDTELYIKSREKCVEKSSLKQYTMNDMKKCWRCNGADNFKKCLNGEKPHNFCPEDYTDGK